MKGVHVFGIIIALALIIFGAVYPVPEKHMAVSGSYGAYDYPWSKNIGAEYINNDSSNYQIEASLKAGYVSGVLAMKAITFVGGLLIFLLTLYSHIKCSAIEAINKQLTNGFSTLPNNSNQRMDLNETGYQAPKSAPVDRKDIAPSYITFGTYLHKAGTDATPIEWQVLEREGNKALLISRYGLDVQPYNMSSDSTTWEKCTLRTWLNETFMNNAFTSKEQENIVLTNVDNSNRQGYSAWDTDGGNDTQDKIFLLSCAEADKYFGVTYNSKKNAKGYAAPTEYAIAQGASIRKYDGKAVSFWWLRSPGDFQYDAAYVRNDGSLDSINVNNVIGCVRPAMWVDLDSDVFQSEV